ncbi:transglutaminase domain-containing protein [Alloactinosynnema sp. L-07]|uniref:transglutaminase family protein n=1 Tax=Alloactinosynnema sp. L-07 TaxID=1653480 RepID=UPI001E5DA8A7|nr:transglutaminase domain-containing protein [Alloactinosynnema sp. L-07]
MAGLLAATGIAGLLFAPVFGLPAVLVPTLVVVIVCYAGVELCERFPVLTPLRPLVLLFVSVLALIEAVLFSTTVAGLPTGDSVRGIVRGLTDGWQLTLQSTWPARPDPDLLLFVPLAVMVACLLGVELLLRLRKPLLSLLPSLAVAGLAQAYHALPGFGAAAAALAFAVPAGLVLWAHGPARSGTAATGPGPRSARVSAMTAWLALPTVVAVGLGAVALGAFDPAGQEPFQLKDGHVAPLQRNRISNPLHEIAQRLADPEPEVFRYRSDAPVDRWTLIVLDKFDGANWSSDAAPRRLGVRLDGAPGGAVRSAEVSVGGLPAPWLPSQPIPTDVEGLAPLVDQGTGTLLLDQSADTQRRYRLSWSVPRPDAETLSGAAVDTSARGGLGELGQVPPDIAELAGKSVLGLRPSFQSALVLERYLSTNYRVETGAALPTGHGWPQLRHFLTKTRRGTSEQFAAAYVVLARLNGIPARLAVGYRGPARPTGADYVVHNRDVLAWPEVAVAGVGWVPLDPTGSATEAGPAQPDLAGVAAQAREQLPQEDELRPPQLPPPPQPDNGADGQGLTWAQAGLIGAIAIGTVLISWLLGVPLAKAARARHRRRLGGADGVIGAWAEARDRLRAHGVPYRVGMTTRDLAESAGAVTGERTRLPVVRLAQVLDMALWSGMPTADSAARRAWDEVTLVRGALKARPWQARIRAAVEIRSLLAPPGRGRGQA